MKRGVSFFLRKTTITLAVSVLANPPLTKLRESTPIRRLTDARLVQILAIRAKSPRTTPHIYRITLLLLCKEELYY